MGKSHLLHATAAAASGRGWRVACHSAEEFTTLYMSALRRESMEDFQRAERGVRLLVIDDIQYLTGKRGITDELTHTIDAVANTGGMVLCSSEEHPSVLSLGERLKSRLLAGVAAQVSCLEQDERIAFIEALATDLRSPIPGWAIARLANVQVCTMRTLRGMVCAAVGLQKARLLDEGRLDAEIILVAAAPGGQPRLTDRELLDAVAEQFGVTLDELAGRSRGGGVRDARAIAVAALKRRGRSLSQIGAVVGGRDRSTIAGLAERGKVLLEDFPALSERLAV
jgi:chromosomal replication initiator protein